ncbi:type 1 glutamine amidotransferase domain-containing protein [Paraburkholderia solisilvae]|uniref:Protein/nucleic acid deglycase HchA n=1 Tax=Paraburkholderia solisilvae TaxID=624376 RepID=A0A6J5DJT4_9BURK|nr:type 1 glutamine amidotransferase domain-containing protein [Paraburkholderia solisilvae]CAB3754540.1 Protein/nucleic acid deglycase HchA [Paraburkholderia solisilvae]
MYSVLMILTGATSWTQKDGIQRPTGFWAEEFAVPHETLSSAGVAITLATPGGKPAPVDALSLTPEANHGDVAKAKALSAYVERHAEALRLPRRIEDMSLTGFDAVFVPGGHGPMQDLAVDANVGKLLSDALADPKKVVCALCHGQASFLAAGDASSWAFKGRRLTAFTNAEETQAGLAANAPWLLEDRLRAAGASFDSGAPWSSHVVVDGNLVTGQNPASAEAAAKAVLDLLAERVERV